MTDRKRFGVLLREVRKRAGFHTITKFADFLSEHEIIYTDDAIGHWENGRRVPRRDKLVDVLGLLADCDGINSVAQVNNILAYAGYNPLFDEERRECFPNLYKPIPNIPEKLYDVLVGRDDALIEIIGKLNDPRAKPVIVISGLGGIGKTALAYEAVERLMRADVFAKLAWETAKSEEFIGTKTRQRQNQVVDLHSVLLSYARQLKIKIPARISTEKLQKLLRDVLRRESCLLVLDNLETLQSARDIARSLHDLVSPDAVSRVLITSRERLSDIAFVYDYFLPGLSEPSTIELIALEAQFRGADSLLAANKLLAKRIYTITEGMPLAVKLIVSQHLVGITLDDELDRLEAAVDEEEMYGFIYEALWEKLSVPAQQILAGAAAFGTSALRGMLIDVSEVTISEFSQAMPELTRASLIEITRHAEAAKQRYAIHAMTRWFVNAPLVEMWNSQKEDDDPTEL
jgi:hypothetical protein